MANNQNTEHNTGLEVVEETLTKTEQYIERNQKGLSLILLAIIVVVGGYIAYQRYIVIPNEREAQAQMFTAEQYFERDSFNLALNGDGNQPGFLSIIEDYSSTKTGNLAKYYAGVCYLHIGKFEEAIDQLSDYDSNDQIIGPQSVANIGDAYIELNKVEEAITYYKKAADMTKNEFLAPIVLKKLGLAYESVNKFKEAEASYTRIQKEYFNSTEARMIEKYITRAQLKQQQ